MIGEVKKILEKGRTGVKVTSNGVVNFIEYPISIDEIAQQICQLFEEESGNNIVGRLSLHNEPDGVTVGELTLNKTEPISEDRLLTDWGIINLVTEYRLSGKKNRHILARSVAKAQDTKTAKAKDADFRDRCANCDSVALANIECQKKIEEIFEELGADCKHHYIATKWTCTLCRQALKDRFLKSKNKESTNETTSS